MVQRPDSEVRDRSRSRRASPIVIVPSQQEILITQVFDAPADAVFRCWTDPSLIRQWWGGDQGEVTSVDVDPRNGGTWRLVVRHQPGFEVVFSGIYQRVTPPTRIVMTEAFEGEIEDEAVIEVTFDQADGATTMRILSSHQSEQGRDAQLAAGTTGGLQGAFERLAQLAQSLT